jgi:hypothetical protein
MASTPVITARRDPPRAVLRHLPSACPWRPLAGPRRRRRARGRPEQPGREIAPPRTFLARANGIPVEKCRGGSPPHFGHFKMERPHSVGCREADGGPTPTGESSVSTGEERRRKRRRDGTACRSSGQVMPFWPHGQICRTRQSDQLLGGLITLGGRLNLRKYLVMPELAAAPTEAPRALRPRAAARQFGAERPARFSDAGLVSSPTARPRCTYSATASRWGRSGRAGFPRAAISCWRKTRRPAAVTRARSRSQRPRCSRSRTARAASANSPSRKAGWSNTSLTRPGSGPCCWSRTPRRDLCTTASSAGRTGTRSAGRRSNSITPQRRGSCSSAGEPGAGQGRAGGEEEGRGESAAQVGGGRGAGAVS